MPGATLPSVRSFSKMAKALSNFSNKLKYNYISGYIVDACISGKFSVYINHANIFKYMCVYMSNVIRF